MQDTGDTLRILREFTRKERKARIDPDVREEYWVQIRNRPDRVNEEFA
jgi:hypothetical protein